MAITPNDKRIPRIIGTGYFAPITIRENDDPVFDWIKKNDPGFEKLFTGYKYRHVLLGTEDLMTMMVPAAQAAISASGVDPKNIDILLGTGSIGMYSEPNPLSELHWKLGLKDSAWSIPVENDFSNFNSALLIADGLLRAGHAQNILICIGGNWASNVDYHTPQSVSAADGAGAAVVSLSDDITKWSIVHQHTLSATNYYGSMFTAGVEINRNMPYGHGYGTMPPSYSHPFFQITPDGMVAYKTFGVDRAAGAVVELLNTALPGSGRILTGADITLMPHQSSKVLIDKWLDVIKPAQCFDTLADYANITVATHALNFAVAEETNAIEKDFVVFLALGPDIHANALLLQRGE